MRLLFCALLVIESLAQTKGPDPFVESIVPSLDTNSACWSVVALENLGDRDVMAQVEAHKNSGALIALSGHGVQAKLSPGERIEYKLASSDELNGAWVRIRERVPLSLSPVLAVNGATECGSGETIRTVVRDVVWPTRNPWYSGNVEHGDERIIAVINTSERPAQVWGCYSSGVLYSVPKKGNSNGDLTPLCSETIREIVTPFGARRFPVARQGNTRFSLTTQGDAVVLQMLRRAGAAVKTYTVDSSITFGKEVPEP